MSAERPRPLILHVTTVPESLGFLRGQARYLRSRGCDVAAVSSPGGVLDSFGREEGLPVYPVAMSRRITPLADLVSLFALYRIFRRLRPSVIHAHTPKGGLLGMLAGWAAGVPVRFYTLHGLPLETAEGLKRTILRWTERLSCGLAKRVFAVSGSLRRRALAEGLCPAEKLRVLGPGTVNGIDAETRFTPELFDASDRAATRRELGIPPEARVIGFVGRVVRDKGVEDLVEAWADLRDRFPDAHLLLVGPFEPQDPISAPTERTLRFDSRVHVTGHVASTAAMYTVMDVVALPTYREGFPQVALEAAAMARPIVATETTGCVDAVLPGETGTLVPPRDPWALGEALGEYLEDPALREEHGKTAQERVRRVFRPDVLWELTHAEYRNCLGLQEEARRERPAPRRRPMDLLLKRVLDVAVALLGLTLLGPLFLAIALVLLVSQGRPIFFRQRRPGWHGRIFTLLKFRTMRPGKEPDAARMSAVGRFLRSSSLDEIPQLWNVLRGDMSLVGPRPLLVEYLARYLPWQARRHEVRPGITGWAQVNGRNSVSWDRKFALDIWYVDHATLRVDLDILFKTLKRVVSRAGINGPGNAAVPEFMGGRWAGPSGPLGTIRPETRMRQVHG